MVFKPFTHLARPIFAKSFTHGYAQSVVAASQSSYASQTTSFNAFGPSQHKTRFGKAGTPQLHNALSTAAAPAPSHRRASVAHAGPHVDGGLAAYYAAWQQGHAGDVEPEWKQFQFAKRIGWTASAEQLVAGEAEIGVVAEAEPTSETVVAGSVDVVEAPPEPVAPVRPVLGRSQSVNALDDIKKVEESISAADRRTYVASHGANALADKNAAPVAPLPQAPLAPVQSPAPVGQLLGRRGQRGYLGHLRL